MLVGINWQIRIQDVEVGSKKYEVRKRGKKGEA
jgi:hypothetical protein